MERAVAHQPIKIPVLLGPTASGKTRCCMETARTLGLEIISCDSRQIYRHMDIGTAKPSPEELASVKHWMIDIIDPSQIYSAFQFAAEAGRIIRARAKIGKRMIICGGSGLYFQALQKGMGPRVTADPAIRRRYSEMAELHGRNAVYERLKTVDPVTANASHPSNLVRNIRGLEVFELTGIPLSELKKRTSGPQDLEFKVFILTPPRELLYERINHRVDVMVKNGLWNEFRSLRSRGYDNTSPGLQSLGYKELFGVEEKITDLKNAIETIKRNTRHFAKRQMTWFRNQVCGSEVDIPGQDFADFNHFVRDFIAG